jgi:uncharacterized protein YecE (DUF72 family)
MLHVGALIDRAPGRKYTAALRFAEFSPRPPLPRPGTLASMRAGLPDELVLALRAPRSTIMGARGALRMDNDLEAGLQWLTAAADALKARVVVLNTPADLTPGARSRDLLREYVGRLPRVDGRHYVWVAQGVWEPEDVHAMCSELGLHRGFDPLETKATKDQIAYATLRAFGHRSGFSLASLSDALVTTMAQSPAEAFISVDAERGFDVARRIQKLIEESAALGAAEDAAGAEEDDEDDDLEDEGEEVEGDEDLADDDGEDAEDDDAAAEDEPARKP